MWKYLDKDNIKKCILDLNLINNNWDDNKKIRTIYTLSNNVEKHYRKLKIKKKNGDYRYLLEPDALLKSIQSNILHNILEEKNISKYATAYHKKLCIINNAAPHVNKNKILKLDIKDFFHDINFVMVYNSAFSNNYFPPTISTLLTNLCCYNEYLPQGAKTSPYISNLVLKPFDEYIGKWCEKKDITYTRYCDDMTFSGDFDIKVVKNKVKSFLNELEFELNESKTKVFKKGQRQTVTGITVNNKIQASKFYRKKIRQDIYYIKKFGIESHLSKLNTNKSSIEYLRSLLGKINFVLTINSKDKEMNSYKKEILNILKRQVN